MSFIEGCPSRGVPLQYRDMNNTDTLMDTSVDNNLKFGLVYSEQAQTSLTLHYVVL